MKLYATTKRGLTGVSKGVGSNTDLTVNLKIGNKEVGNLTMQDNEQDGTVINYYPINQNCTEQELNEGRVLLYQSKAKKINTEK